MTAATQWLMFDCAAPQQTLDVFVHTCPPSRISRAGAAWIFVRAPRHANTNNAADESQGDVAGIQPIQHRVLSGKWLLFLRRSTVDADWSRIAAATANGYLDSGAKVSPREQTTHYNDRTNEPTHVVCVYVDDFTDARDVWRVRSFLQLMNFTQHLSFKADAYTHLGIYPNNAMGISPTLPEYSTR